MPLAYTMCLARTWSLALFFLTPCTNTFHLSRLSFDLLPMLISVDELDDIEVEVAVSTHPDKPKSPKISMSSRIPTELTLVWLLDAFHFVAFPFPFRMPEFRLAGPSSETLY